MKRACKNSNTQKDDYKRARLNDLVGQVTYDALKKQTIIII